MINYRTVISKTVGLTDEEKKNYHNSLKPVKAEVDPLDFGLVTAQYDPSKPGQDPIEEDESQILDPVHKAEEEKKKAAEETAPVPAAAPEIVVKSPGAGL